jgi:phosphatidylinositol glycan class K
MARIVMLQQPVFGQFINGLTFNATTSKEQAGSWPKNLNTKSNPQLATHPMHCSYLSKMMMKLRTRRRNEYNRQNKLPSRLLIIAILLAIINTANAQSQPKSKSQLLKPSNHTKNVAVIVSSSTFYHNYRHSANALTVYQSLKTHGGFTDDNIILMLADEVACNAKNPFKDSIYPMGSHNVDIYSQAQVDYTGNDVTVDNFFRILLGRHEKYTPAQQRLHNIDSDTNLFIYTTGHGGDGFFKFRDAEDYTTKDLRGVFEQLQIMKRFRSILYLTDTCQAFTTAPNTREENADSTLGELINVYTVASSLKNENSYAHHSDSNIGHSVIDRYVFHFVTFMGGFYESKQWWLKMHEISVKDAMVNSMYDTRGKPKLAANVGWSDLGCRDRMETVPLSDYFVMKNGIADHRDDGDDFDADMDVVLIEHAVDFGSGRDRGASYIAKD